MDAKDLLLKTQDAIKRMGTINDESEAFRVIDQSFKALARATEYLQNFNIENQNYCEGCGRKGISYEAAGKTAGYLAKITNDTVRLMELYKGNADSRAATDNGMADLVKKLKSDQLALVLQWMDENEVEKSS